jgi:predicted esterase
MAALGAVLLALQLAAATGLQSNIAFTETSPLARNDELARRMLTPLLAQQVMGAAIRDQPLDLAAERFTLYVPDAAPASGYALLVFIPPWPEARVPSHWLPVLDRHGMIFVTAANSGNDAATLGRRAPLALDAAANVLQRYRIDPQRVYVGGFSGGSRVALRVAAGYPDLFRGALLQAGSDVLGEAVAIPPAPLLARLQETMRIVFLTGEHDDFHIEADKASRRSLEAWCVFDVDAETVPREWHEPADPAAFSRALDTLEQPAPSDPVRLAACRGEIRRQLDTEVQRLETLIASGKREAAEVGLTALDARYGGLAREQSSALAAKFAESP